ncbi:MAG: hypothetical protein AB1586_12890 [Pseudomonadota bacterium]
MKVRFDTILIWGIALLLAALAPVLILTLTALRLSPYDPLTIVSFCAAVAFPAALTFAVIAGVPVALLCRARRWTHWGVAILGGFPMGVIATFAVSGFFGPATGDPMNEYVFGGLLGMCGALAFWGTLKPFGELEPVRKGAAGQAPV